MPVTPRFSADCKGSRQSTSTSESGWLKGAAEGPLSCPSFGARSAYQTPCVLAGITPSVSFEEIG